MSLNNKSYIELTNEQVNFLSVNFGILSFSTDHRERITYIHLRGQIAPIRGVLPEAIIVRYASDATIPGSYKNTQLVYSNAVFEEVFLQAGIPLGE
jgi:hypothetical protein